MKFIFLIFTFLFSFRALCQKIEILAGIYGHYTNITKSNINRNDIKMFIPKIYGTYCFDIFFKNKKNHKYNLNINNTVIGNSFSIKNKYISDTSIGINSYKYSDGIDMIQISFSCFKTSSKTHLLISNLKFNTYYKIGLGVGINKSNLYYLNYYNYQSFNISDHLSFIQGNTINNKVSNGLFIVNSFGLSIKNKKYKICNIEITSNFGIKKMIKYLTNYKYGKYLQNTNIIDQGNFTEVTGFEYFTKGSSFGIKFSIPLLKI